MVATHVVGRLLLDGQRATERCADRLDLLPLRQRGRAAADPKPAFLRPFLDQLGSTGRALLDVASIRIYPRQPVRLTHTDETPPTSNEVGGVSCVPGALSHLCRSGDVDDIRLELGCRDVPSQRRSIRLGAVDSDEHLHEVVLHDRS